MKKEFKNIDSAFRERLNELRVSPPSDVWEGINSQISNSGRRKLGAFYKIAAAIAAIALIGSLFLNKDVGEDIVAQNDSVGIETDDKITQAENKTLKSEPTDNNMLEENIEKREEIKLPTNNNQNNLIAKVIVASPKEEEVEVGNNTKEQLVSLTSLTAGVPAERIALVLASSTQNKSNKNVEEVFLDDNLLLALSNLDLHEEDEQSDKWTIGGDFTPLFSYRHITKTSNDYDPAYYNSVESPVMSYTGGLNVQFKPKDRLSIQTGVYYSSIGQSLDYMTVYSNRAYGMVADEYKDRFVNSYEIDNSAGSITFNTSYVIVDELASRVNNMSINKGVVNIQDPIFQDIEAEVEQYFRYIEIPFLLRYKLIDRIVDLNIIGGLGANFLVGNDVILSYANVREVIGKTNGVDPINYSSSFGIGVEYPLMEKINIRFEPSIKYYLNSINSSSSIDAHPYSIGIYTGINYTF